MSQQRRHQRRILIAFAVIVGLLPITQLGDRYALLLLPMVLVALAALREALLLRASVRRARPAAPPEQ